ncbi:MULTISPECIES: DnaJ domain-containing protein [unclassified Clostridium]|uniref:J domain-containing protein n=1 Tax=unclassified Clostridium TaxID=2614128 RepID=UPI00023AFBE3|nr:MULTISPECIES: DnaJ domain-containing protein [unclassified Clostridium]EHJ00150.1 heat shock protein DnaJ domain protein [Clostridium sp. DL-VIII]OOM78482.1 chaperone protein DnaJ [Clostridium sp. BL-8]
MDPYEALGIERTASEEEIKSKFKEVIEEYAHNQDNTSEQKIQTLRTAYDLIINEELYKEIRALIDSNNFLDAETKLNILNNTNSAEWNYLKGFVLVQKGWYESGLNYLTKATQLEPDNIEYLSGLNKLQTRFIDYIKKYSQKNVQPNSNNVNACGGNNNGSSGGTC